VSRFHERPKAVLFDRDGTLVVDVPYNGDPARVRPMPSASEAVRMVRDAGLPIGVVTNQSAVARGLVDLAQVRRVNERVAELLGPIDVWQVCPHRAEDACACRKPRPGMLLAAAAELGVEPHELAMVGDIGADMEAAAAIGALAVLVPTLETRSEEIDAAPLVAPDLVAAIDLLLEDE